MKGHTSVETNKTGHCPWSGHEHTSGNAAVRAYLDGLPWHGNPRLQRFKRQTTPVEDSRRAVARRMAEA